jgi:RNA polymerase sigma-70 factor (ECF subfamily)
MPLPEALPGSAPSDAVGPLPPAHWTALILRDVLHWSADDTAALLGVSRAELAAALHRAREAVCRGRGPAPAERAALSRLVGTTDARVVSLTGALLREHAPPVPRSA